MLDNTIATLQADAVELLKRLIATPSFSKEEDKTADIIQTFLIDREVIINREINNIWAQNLYFDPSKPTILLNSHHDTVKPNTGYTLNPFQPIVTDGKLYGLGSNDAGGALVALISTFLYFYKNNTLKYNIIMAATAEEEISGRNGVELIYKKFLPLDFAIVGEPTNMQLAIAEKGLLVLDCIAHGVSGHAAREVGDNAIYKAMKDIEWIRNYQFPKISDLLGPVKMSVTIINSGTQQHNVIPDTCTFTIDIRVTDVYKNEDIVDIIKQHVSSEVVPRSIRLKPSSIDKAHPIVQAGVAMGKTTFASPTTSDQSLMDCPSLKIGPGDSSRSHTADEFIYIAEVQDAIADYITMLKKII
ncbi:MAG: M20 family metallo-hydrolase [Cytophagales bacterium]|nr:M20 family metallo-hydrolase [Cytophagales bacterium]